MDEFLSTHDFSAVHEIQINAPPSIVYQRLLVSDFNEAEADHPEIAHQETYASGSKVRALLSWQKFRTKSLSSA